MSSPGRVLVIDDEASLRQTLSRIFQTAGYETVLAQDGFQALNLLAESVFDLVYLDIHMPGLDGLRILKEIRKKDPKLPVILLTGYGSIQSAVEALRLGATDYLLKPVDPDVLVARTRIVIKEQAIERRRQEIQANIEILQAELKGLVHDETTIQQPGPLHKPEDRFLKRGHLIIDLQARSATFGDVVLDIPSTAFNYLSVLTESSPETVDYKTLVSEAQDFDIEISEARALAKWHIHVLRQALENNPQQPVYILNIRGIGYRLSID